MLEGNSRTKFSIRQMMLLVFFLALFSFLAAAAYAGDPLAYGVVLATFGLVIPVCCIVVLSGLAIFVSQCKSGWSRTLADSEIQTVELTGGNNDAVAQALSDTDQAQTTENSEGTE
ncbi:hypothetical protein N9061_03140 [bacterium]|nr:hypothetical protein [bacterium]MDA7879848.1 hypothetical protein [Mariniblastus sp.]MDA7923942.1 hypothetical protein [Mariniblastus sp.]MDA7928892.1 hypothetical protein [Mariniblastus sp.]MDB4379752.1 hypothetical protein [Mariniblastus sp.]